MSRGAMRGRRRVRSALALALACGLALFGVTPGALALEPAEMLADPALEARAREISKELRCLVCQNESIDASHADFAKDMRRVVRERLAAGDSDSAVIAHIRARYGDMVLLRPPVQSYTMLLWFGPALLLLGGAYGVWRSLRRRATDPLAGMAAAAVGADMAGRGLAAPPVLSDAERRRLDVLLADADGKDGTDGAGRRVPGQ